MKKLLAHFLGGVILIAGINCTKDSSQTRDPQNIYFRGEGINVKGEAISYSREINFPSPKKRNKRSMQTDRLRSSLGPTDVEVFGNTPSGQTIVGVTNNQSCTTDVWVEAQSENDALEPNVYCIKTFAPESMDTFNLSLPGRYYFFVSQATTNCGDFRDLDAYNFVSFSADLYQLPLRFQSFDVQKISELVYRVTFVIPDVSDLTDADHINIQASIDQKTWRTIKVVQAKDIQLGKPYSVEVNVK